MQHSEKELTELNELIDRAVQNAGGRDTNLASTLKVPRQKLSDWRAGRKTCQPEDQAVLASIAGMNAMEVLARATVKQHEGTPKGDLLMRALGKTLLATGGVLGTAGASAAEIFSLTTAPGQMADWIRLAVDTMYIMLNGKCAMQSIAACAC